MSERVRVYSTDYCPYCVRAKALLARRGIRFEEIDLTDDPAGRAELVKTCGRRTVPQIFIDDVAIGGSDELHELDRRGALAALVARSA